MYRRVGTARNGSRMTEPPTPKKDGTDAGRETGDSQSRADQRDKTAVISQSAEPPAASLSGIEAGASDRTMVVGDRGPAIDEEGTVLAPPARGRARLLLHPSDGEEQEIPLLKPETTIGRSSGCDVVLEAPTVSRVHARIAQEAAGCLLIPVGTRHNTYVNDEYVSQPRLLHDGDRIQLASEKLVFHFDERPAHPEETPSRRAPMLFAFGAALAAVALIFVAWRQTHPSPAIPVTQTAPDSPEDSAKEEQIALVQQALKEAEQRQREEQARLEEQRGQAEEERRQEEEKRRNEAQIRKYLYEGDVAFLERRYTTPPDGSAVFAYSEVLRLDPNNPRALDQVARIVDEYLSWAEAAAALGERTRARKHYERAVYVHGEVPSAGDAENITARLEALRERLGID